MDSWYYEGSRAVKELVYEARERDGWFTDEQLDRCYDMLEIQDAIRSDPEYIVADSFARSALQAARYSFDPELWRVWAKASVAAQRVYFATGMRLLRERELLYGN